MLKSISRFGAVAALCATFGLMGATAQAQTWPTRQIQMILGFPPGPVDIVGRPVAAKLQEALGQTVVFENRPGANGAIATEQVMRAAPDGYTILLATSGTHVTAVHLTKNLRYNPVKDFEPINVMLVIPLLMVAPTNAPYSTVNEFIDWARKNRDKANYCSIGSGSPSHLAAELFKSMARVDMTHVPHKGSGPAIVDTIAGTCQVLFDSAVSSGPPVRSGTLKALAIATAERVPSWEKLPTIAESGVPGFNAYTWGALLAPAGTPKAIVNKLNAEVVRILAMPEVRDYLSSQGAIPGKGTPEDLATFTNQEIAKWAKVIRDGNIKAD